MSTAKTPGYNSRLRIWFQNDRHGRERAYYWSYMRAIPIGAAKARAYIAADLADDIGGHPIHGTLQQRADRAESDTLYRHNRATGRSRRKGSRAAQRAARRRGRRGSR